jgi:hypothetical protein
MGVSFFFYKKPLPLFVLILGDFISLNRIQGTHIYKDYEVGAFFS